MIDRLQCEHQGVAPANDEVEEPELPTLIEELANPTDMITSPTGRRVSVQADGETDRITVRGHGGEVVLRIEVGEGPVLRFDAAEIELAATKRVAVKAPIVELAAAEHLELASDGAMDTTVRGTRHSRVAGTDRLEAAAIESQAERGVTVRAGGRIALDGEHIGLNDDPCPAPFAWSDAALRRGTMTDASSEIANAASDEPETFGPYDERNPPPLDFERWARIAASLLGVDHEDRDDHLVEQKVDPALFDACEAFWSLTIARQIQRGEMGLAKRYAAICTGAVERQLDDGPKLLAEPAVERGADREPHQDRARRERRDVLQLMRPLVLFATVVLAALGCSRTKIAPEPDKEKAKEEAAPAPIVVDAGAIELPTRDETCETERIDDLCAFLRRVTEGLAKDPATLACPHPEGKPRVAWGSRKCVASSVGLRAPFLCGLDWPGDDRIDAVLEEDGRRIGECLKGWEVTKKQRAFEAKSEKVRCELLNPRSGTYSLVCSRRNR